MYAYQLIYTATILSVKLSILTYYVRIFQIRPFRIAVYAVGSLVVVWAITVWFISIFSCRPINGFWDTSVTSSCVSNKEFYVGNAVPNICTDVMILILPLRMVWALQTTRMQKVTLSGIFLLGGLSVPHSLYCQLIWRLTNRRLVWWYAVVFGSGRSSRSMIQILPVSLCRWYLKETIAHVTQGP